MNSTPLHRTHPLPRLATPRPIARRRDAASPAPPSWGEVFDERAPIIDAPFFYGPPMSFVLVPWLFLVLLLVGPFTLILTLLLSLVAAVGLLTAVAALIASPYLLIRRLHGRGIVDARARTQHLLRQPEVLSGRLGSLQPKGMS